MPNELEELEDISTNEYIWTTKERHKLERNLRKLLSRAYWINEAGEVRQFSGQSPPNGFMYVSEGFIRFIEVPDGALVQVLPGEPFTLEAVEGTTDGDLLNIKNNSLVFQPVDLGAEALGKKIVYGRSTI